MKVLMNNINSTLKSSQNYIQPKSDIKGKEQKQNCDTITIGNAATTALPENQFINMLKSHIAQEVKAGASTYKLNDLRNQVALDQYDINPIDIARRMLMDNGEG